MADPHSVDPSPRLALDPEFPRPAHEPEIPQERLDQDAVKVIARLRHMRHQAYLVGGCVRDLLLEHNPKDFDIATDAHPGEVRAIFRNCRLIGRRFRLAHVYFREGKVIEVATFRKNPTDVAEDTGEADGDLLITRDNVFGTAEEDAVRRRLHRERALLRPRIAASTVGGGSSVDCARHAASRAGSLSGGGGRSGSLIRASLQGRAGYASRVGPHRSRDDGPFGTWLRPPRSFEVLQRFAQLRRRIPQPALHGLVARAGKFGNFRERQTRLLLQQERIALRGRQFRERAHEPPPDLPGGDARLRLVDARAVDRMHALARRTIVVVVDRNETRLARHAPVIDQSVVRERVELRRAEAWNKRVPARTWHGISYKWLLDLLACRLGGDARFNPDYATALKELSRRARLTHLLDVIRRESEAGRWVDHPLNRQMVMESWLVEYGRIFEGAGR